MQKTENALPEITRFLRKKQLLQATGLSDTTLWRLIRAKEFPQAVRLGPNSWGWRLKDYQSWAENPQLWVGRNKQASSTEAQK